MQKFGGETTWNIKEREG